MKPKIVLIDSNEKQKNSIKELLSLANYEVETANDQISGLAIINSFFPNLILSNIYLPEIEDGLALFKNYKSQSKLRTIPFVFIANTATKTLIRTLMDFGADDVISTTQKKYKILKIIKLRLNRVEVFSLQNKKSHLYQKPDKLLIHKELNKILSVKKLYHFNPNETIYCAGNKSNHIFLIKNGTVKTYETDNNGKEFIISFFTSEQYFGYTSFIKNKPHCENAKAVTSTFIYKISREEILTAIQKNNKILYNFMDVIVNDLIKLKKQIILLAYASVRKKTAETLGYFNHNFPIKNGTTITINRTDLADSIGIAKETLIRTLHDFKNEKLISLTKKSVTILDEKKLKEVQ
ncbi:cyclic nucleotide-binding domain-containing protein [Lutibacter sp.]|uniref:cyclic nucleotide-binding domain-containing protein n=1 Tax=Lutibacter sp. TaxID=1925666 RepID=UPI0025BB3283|nr:cyclic nucleotide-binding domain-containing protein [Lutibacter sp.]MCF6181777.1 cyclic nucleotide-binding domain-containing protein [Lutibacter sp.]